MICASQPTEQMDNMVCGDLKNNLHKRARPMDVVIRKSGKKVMQITHTTITHTLCVYHIELANYML